MFLETERLQLRDIQPKNVEILHKKIFSDKDVMYYAFSQKTFLYGETKDFIEDHFIKDDSNIGLIPVFEKSTNDLVGIAGILECNYLGRRDFEFGFILAKEHWNKGYATEIGKVQIDFAFDRLNLDRILALTNPQNVDSKKVLGKLHMLHLKDITAQQRGLREIYILENK